MRVGLIYMYIDAAVIWFLVESKSQEGSEVEDSPPTVVWVVRSSWR